MSLSRLLLILFILSSVSVLNAAEMRVGAASNLRFVLPELARNFEQQTGHELHISYAASGTLVSQIQHGAPFDVFMSANPEYVIKLKAAGYTQGDDVTFARGALALYTNKIANMPIDVELASIKQALENNTLKKVVIANPQHAPYGQLAKQLLEEQGLWQALQPCLLIAENASQSLQFSMSPQVSIGFVPYTYVIQPHIAETGHSLKLNLYLPQQAVAVRGGSYIAKDWLEFLSTTQAKTILVNHGFDVDEKVNQ